MLYFDKIPKERLKMVVNTIFEYVNTIFECVNHFFGMFRKKVLTINKKNKKRKK